MIVPILGHFPQPCLQLFEGLNGSFKFIKFCFRLTEKGLTFFIFMIYQDLTKSDHRPVPPDVAEGNQGFRQACRAVVVLVDAFHVP